MIKKNILPVTVAEIATDYIGDGNFDVSRVSSLSSCDESCIAFYKGDDISFIKQANCGALIVRNKLKKDLKNEVFKSHAIIFCEYPMAFFTDFVNLRFNNNFTDDKIKKTENLISKFAYVESKVIIGSNCQVYPHATVYAGTMIGDNCSIQSNSVIGGIGMSYIQDDKGKHTRLTHLGNVIIEDNVDIGCNTTVLRGILESTIIKQGAKIGNQVNVGHNSIIGDNTYISAGAVVGGATQVGKNCWIAPGVSIRDNIKIGNNCTIGVGSVVVKDTEPNSVYIGNPAKLFKNK